MIGKQTFYADEAPAQLALIADGVDEAPIHDAMRQCADIMRQSVRDNFTSSATPDGSSWPQRKIQGDGHPLLMDTGRLLQAATGGGAGQIEIIQGREVAMGVDGSVVPYAATHNFGRGAIPAREYAGIKPEHQAACEQTIAEGLMAEVFG
jgi:phage virion morphogenesis protein